VIGLERIRTETLQKECQCRVSPFETTKEAQGLNSSHINLPAGLCY
jgi:hypothetical protein